MLEFKDVSKIYNKGTVYTEKTVLNKINMKLEEGKVYGLVGRNGAGKTTLLKVLSNQIAKYEGTILWNGEEVYENQRLVEEIIYVSDDMIDNTTDKDRKLYKIFKTAKDLYKKWDDEFLNYLVETFKLDVQEKYSKLSKGNKTLVNLILGLCTRGDISLFDEPSTGLDANNRYKFYKILMEDLEEHPRTVIISTHLIDEVESVLEEVIFIDKGNIIFKEEVDEIQSKSWAFTGKPEELKSLENKNIVYRDSMGSMEIVGIFDHISSEERRDLQSRGVDIGSISLQKLVVYMTEEMEKNESESADI